MATAFSLESPHRARQYARRRNPPPVQRRLVILLLILACPVPTAAQIATPEGVQLSPFPVLQAPSSYPSFSDGDGMWTVFIGDHPGSALYAQHIRGDGSFAPPCTPAAWRLTGDATQVNSVSASGDGLDGAVVAWFGVTPTDSLSPFIALRYLHLLGEGEVVPGMPDTGLVVSHIASAAMVVDDALGGAYVVWEELKGASNPDIFAQHYSYWGTPLWTPLGSPSGVPVCAVVGIQRLRALHADGQGGAYVVWADMRAANSAPLYVARLEPDGVAGSPWTTNGVRVSPITPGIRIVGSSASPAGGLWLAWRDIGNLNQVNGQHVAPNAAFRWVATGALLATVTPVRGDFVPGPSGQAFFTWGGTDLRCSKLDSTGIRMWSESAGRVLVGPPYASLDCHAAPDGANGQRLAWAQDNSGQNDIRVLNVDATGAPRPGQSPTGSVFAGTAANEAPVAWFTSASGEPALEWLENGVLKIRRLPTTSLAVDPTFDPNGIALAAPYPNPVRGARFTLRFVAPAGAGRAELFDTGGRRVAEREIRSAGGEQSLRWDQPKLPPGVYALRVSVAGRTASRRIVSLE